MKKTALILMITVISLQAFAKKPEFKDTFKKYSGVEGCEVIHLGGFVSGFANLFAGAQLKEEGIEKIKGLDVLSIEDKNLIEEVMKDVMKEVKKSDMKEMMRVYEQGEEVYMYFSGTKEKASDFLIVSKEEDELSVVYMQGVFNLETISQN